MVRVSELDYFSEQPILVLDEQGNGAMLWFEQIISGSAEIYVSHYTARAGYALYESLDDGESWSKVTTQFGDEPSQPDDYEPILRLLVVDNQIYATGWGVLARSEDDGRAWTKISGDWQTFATGIRALSISPDQSEIWYGGQGAFENIVVGKVLLADGQEQPLGEVTSLLPNPSVTKAIRFDYVDNQRVFIAAEGGIVQSEDNGTSWSPFSLNNSDRFHFDMIADDLEPGRFYTAGWSKITDAPQPLILDVTSDNGAHWRHYRYPDSLLFGGVYSMASRMEQGERVIYAGLFKGCVIQIKDIP